jgi:arylsulfatase A
MIRRRLILIRLLSALLGVLCPWAAWAAPPDRPNVLLIVTDNVGYGDLGCYGNRAVKTPNQDRLAEEGVRCTDFYAAPSCSPSRGLILTGRHPERNGLNHQLSSAENMGGVGGLPATERIIPQYLKPLGYATGCFGKWNIGFSSGVRPTERGFDDFLGFRSGNIGYYSHVYHGENDLRLGTEPIDRRGTYSTDLFADAAIDFIRQHRAQPWFVYLPFNAVHSMSRHNLGPGEKVEWQVPAKYLALYGCPADEPDRKKRFRAVLTALDDAIGRVLGAVDDLDLRRRTLVLCVSDNGAFMLPGVGLEEQSNLPLRDGGVTTYEGGIRTPAIVRWPGRIRPGTVCRETVSALDILPLVVTAAGGALPTDRVLDGRDIAATLAGDAKSPHEALYFWWDEGRTQRWRAMRRGDDKIVRKADGDPWQLYDLRGDVGESKDLAKEKPGLTADLAAGLDAWHRSVMMDPTRGVEARAREAR